MGLVKLTEEQQAFYQDNGYLIGLEPAFSPDEVAQMNLELQELSKLLEADETLQNIREWHLSSSWLYGIITNPQILSYVEGILGPDFFVWGSQFFAKAPGTKDTVPWHQDAYYWPLDPHNTVTVWLAFTDVDEGNGAMKVIPRTHRAGLIKHRHVSGDHVLSLELEQGTYNESDAKSLVLRAGQLSLHDDNIVHGSPANLSDRWRIGLTIRYSGTNVKCDMSRSPNFVANMVHGEDRLQLNPQGPVPTERFARLPRSFHIASLDEA